ncbi:MAG: hypothetical protein HQ512_10340 [Rhodospirillales bacterium]|nr:hypothetical protein [Rhodospirillales bacterium]
MLLPATKLAIIVGMAENKPIPLSTWIWIAVVLLGIVFAANRPPPPESWSWVWLGKKIWNMPGGMGALFGIVAGFFTLIAAQNHKAKRDREAHKERQQEEKRLLAAGLNGELRAVITIFKTRADGLRQTASILRKKDQQIKEQQLPIPQEPHTERAFYKANAGKLSLLGANLTKHVTLMYEALAATNRMASTIDPTTIATLIDTLPNTADSLKKRIPGISDLADRLEAVAQGEDDPGPKVF